MSYEGWTGSGGPEHVQGSCNLDHRSPAPEFLRESLQAAILVADAGATISRDRQRSGYSQRVSEGLRLAFLYPRRGAKVAWPRV